MDRGLGLGAAVALLTGACGGKAGQEQGPAAEPSGDVAPSTSPLGWSVRDTTPYARSGHGSAVDPVGDRMIIFGGNESNDVWQLPLSGEHENAWQPLVPSGLLPPGPALGLYDPTGARLIVRVDSFSADGSGLWTLTLDDEPAWQPLAAAEAPRHVLSSSLLALDAVGNRLFVVGGDLESCETWSLTLDEPPTWTRLGPAPDGCFVGIWASRFDGASLTFDSERERLIAVRPDVSVWQMPLATATWSELTPLDGPPSFFAASAVYDEVNDSLLISDKDASKLRTFSLATDEWGERPWPGPLDLSPQDAIDVARHRLLSFSDYANDALVDATQQLSLDSLELSELVPESRRSGLVGAGPAIWDPVRQLVVGLGLGPQGTTVHALEPDATWQVLAGTEEGVSPLNAIYDTKHQAVVVFGIDYANEGAPTLARLGSAPDAGWERIEAAGGPRPRGAAVSAFDAARGQLVLRGGYQYAEPGSTTEASVDEVWTLSLDDWTWSELTPSGESPGARSQEVGVYDPVGQRLIVWGGERDGVLQRDLHALSLKGAPTWSVLDAAGPVPEATWQGGQQAFYDAERRRVLVVIPTSEQVNVFALELGQHPTWHRFCSLGVPPTLGSTITLTPDGLFAAISNGVFRFNLDTSYCD